MPLDYSPRLSGVLPGDRVLAYFGSHRRVMKRLAVSGPTALELMDLEIL